MSTSDPEAIEIAAQMVSNYLTGDAGSMTDPVEEVLDDPRLLGAVMVQLTIIAGEVLRTATGESGADPHDVLRNMVERLGGTID